MVCRMALRKGFSSFRSNLLDFAIILQAVIASVVLVFFILAGILSASGNVEFSETSNADYMIKSDIRVTEFDAVNEARAEILEAVDGGSGASEVVPQQSVADSEFDIFMLYRAKSGNLLTPANLKRMQEVETRFVSESFYSEICHQVLIDPSDRSNTLRKCARPVSIVQLPAAQLADLTKDESATLQISTQATVDMTRSELDALLAQYAVNSTRGARVQSDQPDPALWTPQQLADLAALSTRGLLFGKRFGKCQNASGTPHSCTLQAEYMRSYFPMGLPLQGFRNENDRIEEQELKFDDLIAPFRDYIISDYENSEVEAIIFGNRIISHAFNTVVQTDLYWAGGSIVFVVLYLCYHTNSAFLGVTGILQILMSMPVAIFFYRVILQISFFQTLHSLAIFIILGIGADNIFVFIDAFEQAPTADPEDYFEEAGGKGSLQDALKGSDADAAKLAKGAKYASLTDRLAYTFRRAVRATAVTSGTTAAAFLATGVSEIMPIATFGYFAASLVVMAWVLNLAFLPALVGFWQMSVRSGELWCWDHCCGLCCSRKKQQVSSKGGESAGDVEMTSTATPASAAPTLDVENPQRAPTAADASMGAFAGKKHLGDENDDVGIQADRAMEACFRNVWSPFIFKARWFVLGGFGVLFILAIVSATNLQPLSKQEEFLPESHYTGRGLKWTDEEFGLTDRDTTVEVTVTWGVSGIDRDGVSQWVPTEKGTPIFDASFDPSAPAAQQALLDTCDEARTVSRYDSELSCWPRALSEYLNSTGRAFPYLNSTDAAVQRSAFTALLKDDFCKNLANSGFCTAGRIGFLSGRIAFAEVVFKTDLEPFQPYATNFPVYEDWQDFVDARNAAAPEGVNNALQTAGQAWQWMISERAFIRNALVGMAISISVALVVLIVSTRNVFVGGLATLTIAGIVATVLGLMQVLGWELGITESISSVIVIGFSVDYVVHYANAYMEAEEHRPKGAAHLSRYERMRMALTLMGVSVLAGALTTFGAGVFLFGAIVIFFTKMGAILLSTIAFSLMWSTLLFPVLMMVFGPEGEYGDLSTIWAGLKVAVGAAPAEDKPLVRNGGATPAASAVASPTESSGEAAAPAKVY